jgi:sarcosine oxidase subunit alpha
MSQPGTQPWRNAEGGVIDRSATLRFRFDETTYTGHPGDTLASALLANGVRLVGRSFKYHRPRGIYTAGSEEPNALVRLREGDRAEPNTRATVVELYDGLAAAAQNAWPTLRADAGAVTGWLAPLFPAGFYYKTFMWPAQAWPLYERAIRRMAGLGRAPDGPDPDRYAHRYDHCDVLVVGGGAAGQAAARMAAGQGSRVILADEQPPAAGIDGVAWLARTTVLGLYDHNWVIACERVADHVAAPADAQPRQRLWQIRAKRIVLATGALERPLVFPGNDRPGVMLAGAAATYLERYAVRPGGRAVVFTNNDSAYAVAEALAAGGVEVAALVDLRPEASPGAARLRERGIRVLSGEAVVATKGRRALGEVVVQRLDGGLPQPIEADLLAVSGGWQPNQHLLRSAGRCDIEVASPAPTDTGSRWFVDGDAKASFVDLQNDVTAADLDLAVREGFGAIEHVKRYTTAGMGTDQGKLGNLNVAAAIAAARGQDPTTVGLTTARPPYVPVTLGAVAGAEVAGLFDPVRETPMQAWHVEAGAVFEPVGQWQRPRSYPRAGEDLEAAVRREVLAVRRQAGLLDASTLGKIDVQGPDAATFLERIYVNNWAGLRVGRCRYGLMLDEQGMVFDDGVTARLAPDRFHMTTTTGNAAAVLAWLENWRQTEWPDLKVWCTSTTEQWAVATLAGPLAAAILAELAPDLGPLAHMSWRDGRVAGLPARMFAVSFTGEPSFEINVAADHGLALWQAALRVGASYGLTPFGTDAMHLLRAEVGFIMVGQETDGTVTPVDLGYERMLSAKKDFIGKRSLARPDTARTDRRQLVGLAPTDPRADVPEGAQLLAMPSATRSEGHVTSSYHSPTLGRAIALALLERGRARHGETVTIAFDGRRVPAMVVSPQFYKAEGDG